MFSARATVPMVIKLVCVSVEKRVRSRTSLRRPLTASTPFDRVRRPVRGALPDGALHPKLFPTQGTACFPTQSSVSRQYSASGTAQDRLIRSSLKRRAGGTVAPGRGKGPCACEIAALYVLSSCLYLTSARTGERGRKRTGAGALMRVHRCARAGGHARSCASAAARSRAFRGLEFF